MENKCKNRGNWVVFDGNTKPPNPITKSVDVKFKNLPDKSLNITVTFKETKP